MGSTLNIPYKNFQTRQLYILSLPQEALWELRVMFPLHQILYLVSYGVSNHHGTFSIDTSYEQAYKYCQPNLLLNLVQSLMVPYILPIR